MSYLNETPRKVLDLASLLHICPLCLGDLVDRSDFAGEYHLCLQCGTRNQPPSRIGRLRDVSADFAAIRDDQYVADPSLSRIA